MTQQSGNQFDDDLTVGMEDNGSFSTDSIDLFEFSSDEESPIARLKTIILSIDWEINDDILQQLDDELVDLGDIWAGDKIKLIYIQGLAKMGKYIFKEKARAHPNAIKLLITFYHNLEKIVSSGDMMNEEERKQLLLEDVRKFDQLKSQIGKPSSDSDSKEMPAALFTEETEPENKGIEQLKVLKAEVLGVDWEITDKSIQKLSDEVQRLETLFGQNKAKRILLQGIGALSSYINKMRSRSNSKAFSLLHSFYDVLEKISSATLSPTDEKNLLLAEVEKFKGFKGEIAKAQKQVEPVQEKVVAAPPIKQEKPVAVKKDDQSKDALPVKDDVEEAVVASDVASRLASVFGDIGDGDDDETTLDKDTALEGVNVETEADDESDEDALPFEDGAVAPALSEVEQESSFSAEKLAGDLAQLEEEEKAEETVLEDESIIQGVDVETEADDDSDEDALPVEDGEIAPALSGSDDESGLVEESTEIDLEEPDSDDLDNRLDSFFDDEVQSSSDEWGREGEDEAQEEVAGLDMELGSALSDIADETPLVEEVPEDIIDEIVEEKLSFFDDDSEISSSEDSVVPALSEETEEVISVDVEEEVAEKTEEALSFLDDEEELVAESKKPEISLPDESVAALPSEDTEKLATVDADDEVIAKTEEALSFLTDEEELGVDTDEAATPVLNDETEELDVIEAEEIAFSVPGEEASKATDVITDEKGFDADDEVIDFLVPGQDGDAVVTETEELVFGAVGDDIAVDVLPGEVSSGAYVSLGGVIVSLKANLTKETLQGLSAEVERLEGLPGSNSIEKIFLQLLSALGQNFERNITEPNPSGLVLLDEIFDGIQKNASSDITPGQIQQHLLNCTSQVLSLQQNDIRSAEAVLPDKQVEIMSVKDEDLAAFVQGELADMKKRFFDEISSLRKEFSNK